MIRVEKYQLEKKSDWDSFVDTAKNGIFMHKRDFMDYHSDRFEDYSLMFFEDDTLIALLPMNIKENELFSHGGLTFGGFIFNNKMKQQRMLNCFDALKTYMREHNIVKLTYKAIPYIYHTSPSQEDLYALVYNNAKIIRRDVSTTIDLKNIIKMPKGRKAQISRARRENVIIAESDDFEAFIELENQVLGSKHNTKAVHNAQELRLLKSRFPNEIHLIVACQNEIMLAAVLIFEYKNMVHTQYMASNEFGRELGALDLLIFEQINKYKETKEYFDFGISTEDAGKFLNEGLISQKEGFGGRSICYDFYEGRID